MPVCDGGGEVECSSSQPPSSVRELIGLLRVFSKHAVALSDD